MSDSTGSDRPSATLTPAANFFSLGSELLAEVQKTLGDSRLKALRLKVGDRTIKEIPITPVTAFATLAVVIGAIIITNLKIEVVKEPLPDPSSAAPAPGGAS
ncbi:MAG: hypothetical protein P4L33_18070 [Capsulimonadaceae bacterium]|nr:hypothetical protein [Capsulimonadaceae bacterium]